MAGSLMPPSNVVCFPQRNGPLLPPDKSDPRELKPLFFTANEQNVNQPLMKTHLLRYVKKVPTLCWGRYKSCSVVRREKDEGVLFYAQSLQHVQDQTDAAVQLHHRVSIAETQT